MDRTKLALSFALLVGLSMPAASAAWWSHGQVEPNTHFDTAGYMFEDPDTSADASSKQVYLNAFPSNSFALTTNANVGLTGSSVYPTPLLFYQAVFGVWKDCNRDGYIGLAESAVQEYRAESLLDASVCPVGSDHNDGDWVYELIQVGTVDSCEKESEEARTDPNNPCFDSPAFQAHPGVVYVESANLWGDQGFPGENLGGSSCPIRPAPRGTFSNSGLILRYADCFVAFRVAQTISDNDATGMLGFDDPKNPHEDPDSVLVQNTPVSVFGNPYDGDGRTGLAQQGTGKPTATVWDCDNGGAPGVGVAADPTDASAFDAADYAVDGAAGDCSADTNSALYGQYYAANLYGQDPSAAGLLEGSNTPSNVNGKDANDFTYTFYDKLARPTGEPAADRAAEGAVATLWAHERDALGERTPVDLGLTALHSNALFGPMWVADVIYVSTPQSISRTTLLPSSRGYWTTYAQIDRAEFAGHGFQTPSPADFIYGEEGCGGQTEGVNEASGWNCDADVWFPLDGGEPTQPQYQDGRLRGARPGELYQFRDVDCYDGSVLMGGPARASLADLSPLGICPENTKLV